MKPNRPLKSLSILSNASTNYGKPFLKNSGELRNGSSLHAWFFDLILFFPASSFILILDRCV